MMTSKRIAITGLKGLWGRCSQALLGLAMGWAVLVGYGCKEKIEPETYYLNPEVKATFFFEPGTYWIYQEDSTIGWTDSVYVTSSECFVELGEGDNLQKQMCLVNYTRSELRFKFILQLFTANTSPLRLISLVEDEELYDGYTDNGDFLFFRSYQGEDTLNSFSDSNIFDQTETIEINGETYYNNITITIGTPSIPLSMTKITVSRGVGIIKMELADGTCWSLLRYHIS